MQKIVFLDRSTLGPRRALRRPVFPHEFIEHQTTSAHQVADRLRGASVAIVNKVDLREDALRQLPDLKLIAVAATGTDCVDKSYCRTAGIAVCNIRG